MAVKVLYDEMMYDCTLGTSLKSNIFVENPIIMIKIIFFSSIEALDILILLFY